MKITRLLYLSISYGNIAFQLLLLPIFANYLGVVAFGEFSFAISIVSWIAFFSTLGTQTKLRRILTGKNINSLGQDSLKEVSNSGVLVVFLFVISSLIFVLINFYSFRVDFTYYQQSLMLVYCLLYITITIQSSILISSDRILLSALIGAVFTSGSLVLANIVYAYINPSWDFRFIFGILVGLVIMSYYRKDFFSIFSHQYFDLISIRRGFKENLVLAGYGLYDKLISLGDKIFVGFYFGVETLAIYTIGFQISNSVYSGAKAFTIFAENSIFKGSNDVFRQYLLTIGFSIAISLSVLVFLNYTFNFLFSADFHKVNEVLYLQLMIAILRVFNNLQFTRSYINGTTKEYLLFCYLFVFIFLCTIYFVRTVSLYEFVLLFLAIQFANSILSLKYAVNK